MEPSDTFADLVFEYWRSVIGQRAGRDTDRQIALLERFVLPRIGSTPVRDLTADDLVLLLRELIELLGSEAAEVLEAICTVMRFGGVQVGCPSCGAPYFHAVSGGVSCATCGWSGSY